MTVRDRRRGAKKGMTAVILAASVLFSAAMLISGCSAEPRYASYSFISMDTLVEIKIDAATPDAEAVLRRCRDITEEQRLLYDADDPDSALSALNEALDGKAAEVPAGLEDVMAAAAGVQRDCRGAFSVFLRDVILKWKSAGPSGAPPSREELAELLPDPSSCAYDAGGTLTLPAGCRRIDLGGIAKGAAEETVVEYLKGAGASYGILSFGGNIAVFGNKPGGGGFVIGIRDPDDGRKTVGTVKLDSGYVSVSGDYERYYEIGGERYHHILDPADGYPAESGLRSVAVIASDGTLADALSTALFVMGKERALELYESGKYEFEAVFVTDGGVSATPGLGDRFEPSR